MLSPLSRIHDEATNTLDRAMRLGHDEYQYLVQATSTCDYETHSARSVIMEAITTGGGNNQIARPWDLERVAAK
jgi:hypothetical protein